MTMNRGAIRRLPIVTAIAAAVVSFAAQAADFETEDGTQIIWNTTVSLGTAKRAANADPRLLHPANATLQGVSGATGGNTDDGDLNYNRGDTFSTLLKLVSDVEVKHDNVGGLVRVKAWTDYALKNNNVHHGSFNTGYRPEAPLSDRGFEEMAKFSGIALLDAYVYGNFETGIGDVKLTAGKHVLNWGESLFLQGVNQINPIDVSALRKPGTEIREVFLPIGMVSASVGLGNGVSVDGFVQAQKATTVVDGCGTYFLAVDASVGPNAQNACAGGFIQARAPSGDATGVAAGLYIPATSTVMPRSGGQFGVAVHFPVAALDTEFGLYAMNIDSRTPILSVVKGNSPFLATTPMVPGLTQSSIFWEYPTGIHIYGISASTTLAGWSVGSELSYTPNLPVQRSPGDLLGGLIYGTQSNVLSSMLTGSPVAGVPIAGLLNANRGPLAAQFNAASNGGIVAGYDRLRKTQLQANAIQGFSNVLGASTLTVAGEVGMQWAGVPSNTDGIRYGRSFVFGLANSPAYNLGAYPAALTQGGACPILNTTGQAGCQNDGFATPFSWGYRLRGQLAYTDAFNSGVTLKPTLAWSSDERGYSADGTFNKGRRILGLSLGAEYAKKYTAEIGYVSYSRSAPWDPLRDRDYYYASVSMAF
jgi:hypothetical protein